MGRLAGDLSEVYLLADTATATATETETDMDMDMVMATATGTAKDIIKDKGNHRAKAAMRGTPLSIPFSLSQVHPVLSTLLSVNPPGFLLPRIWRDEKVSSNLKTRLMGMMRTLLRRRKRKVRKARKEETRQSRIRETKNIEIGRHRRTR